RFRPNAKKAEILERVTGGVYDIAQTGKYIGIATQTNGFYLLDIDSNTTKNFTPDNSGFPSQNLDYVCSFSDYFIIGITIKLNIETYIYRMEPDTYKIEELGRKRDSAADMRIIINSN
ncbi:MAG: hypothetical protein P8016_15685, partial [Sedimentisphaerales bacterium]